MKRLRRAFIAIVVLIIGGTATWCLLAPKKAALESGSACLPVRTTLAAIALIENPTARTYAVVGDGAGAFTNIFEHAGLVAVTNESGKADLVFVSAADGGRHGGRPSREMLARVWARCATNGVMAVHFDVRKKPFWVFKRELEALPTDDWRLWFPGRADALVTLRVNGKPRLADMMDLFSREGLFTDFARAGIRSIESVFASYAGVAADVMPVFGFAKGEVVPECFVTKEVPPFGWIDCTDIDADIRDKVLLEIRSMQVVRRMILEGDILSRDGKMDAAMELWTKAIKRNPDDPLILERICQLDVNAETFMKVGNFPMAAQCLETMICLRPTDVQTIRRLARVFTQMGKKDRADAVNRRADELVKGSLAARRASPVSRPASVPVSRPASVPVSRPASVPVSRLPSPDLKSSTRLESAK